MKHKFLTVLLALVAALCLCFGLAACGEDSENSGNSGDSGSSGSEEGGNNEQGGGNDGDVCEHAFTVQNVCEKCGEKWEFTEGLDFELDKEADGYSVSGIGTASGDIVIPYGYSGKAVTSIGEEAFNNCSTLTSVVIPGSVTVIGYSAFKDCRGLLSVEIPDSVTEIRQSAFRYCSALTSVEIPEGVTEIQLSTFFACDGLTSVKIPESVTKIQMMAFVGCDGLTSVKIPDSVTEIGDSAFMGCSALAKIDVPDGVTKIERCAFRETAYYYDAANWDSDGVLYLGKYLIEAKNTVSGEITVKPGTKVIADSVFGDEITSIIIPDSVITVGEISSKKLKSITVDEQNPNYCSEDGILYNKEKTEFFVPIAFRGDVVLPDSVTTIGREAFKNRMAIASVTIGRNVTSIGEIAFNRIRDTAKNQKNLLKRSLSRARASWNNAEPFIYSDRNQK